MKFIAGAITNLIKNLMPNENRYYVSRNWVTDEIIPTLDTMNQRAIQLKGAIETNKGVNFYTTMICVILGSAILIIAMFMAYCFRNQSTISNRLQNAVHNLTDNAGLRAPNQIPDFRV